MPQSFLRSQFPFMMIQNELILQKTFKKFNKLFLSSITIKNLLKKLND